MASTSPSSSTNRTPVAPPKKLDSPHLKFCDPQADLSFKSSDGVVFKIYSKYLEATSGALPVPKAISSGPDDVVCLQENSEVLELLFQFIHPRAECDNYRQPSVITIVAQLLFSLAEAAEKYQVFGAMNTCVTRLHQFIRLYPIEILNHAYRHGYTDLADQAAKHTISQPLDKVVKGLTHPDALQRWLLYYVYWRDIAATALATLDSSTLVSSQCASWPKMKMDFTQAVLKNTWGEDYLIAHAPHHQPFPSSLCPGIEAIISVQRRMNSQIASIPKFTAIPYPR